MAELLSGLEGSALAAALRGSTWIYPLVNAAHIVGIALLFGSIAALDLRLIGAWRGTPVAMLSRILVPVAATGLGLAVAAGALLFVTRATRYAASPFFQAKMLLVALGIANIAAYYALRRRDGETGAAPLHRLLGAASLALWLSVIVLGRLVGYF